MTNELPTEAVLATDTTIAELRAIACDPRNANVPGHNPRCGVYLHQDIRALLARLDAAERREKTLRTAVQLAVGCLKSVPVHPTSEVHKVLLDALEPRSCD
jgi:hypothetical protein